MTDQNRPVGTGSALSLRRQVDKMMYQPPFFLQRYGLPSFTDDLQSDVYGKLTHQQPKQREDCQPAERRRNGVTPALESVHAYRFRMHPIPARYAGAIFEWDIHLRRSLRMATSDYVRAAEIHVPDLFGQDREINT
jgi:hypothetical protein